LAAARASGGGFFCKENGISIEKELENCSISWQYPHY
jgi:hypothetical protein